MIDDRRAQLTMGCAILRQVVLDDLRKQYEQVMSEQDYRSDPLWPLLQHLPPGSCSDLPS